MPVRMVVTHEMAAQIRAGYREGVGTRALAERFDLGRTTVREIVRGEHPLTVDAVNLIRGVGRPVKR